MGELRRSAWTQRHLQPDGGRFDVMPRPHNARIQKASHPKASALARFGAEVRSPWSVLPSIGDAGGVDLPVCPGLRRAAVFIRWAQGAIRPLAVFSAVLLRISPSVRPAGSSLALALAKRPPLPRLGVATQNGAALRSINTRGGPPGYENRASAKQTRERTCTFLLLTV
jgi:hypothetical protein